MNLEDYPWVWPPPGFIRVDRNNSEAIAAGTTRQVVETIEIPTRQEGWIVLAGVELSEYSKTVGAEVGFTLSQAGVPIRDYVLVTVPLGAPNTPAPLQIQLFPDQPFTLSITNLGPTPLVAARWRFYGYYYQPRGGRR